MGAPFFVLFSSCAFSGRISFGARVRVTPAPENKRRAIPPPVVQHLTDEDHVIPTVVARLVAALEMRRGALYQRIAAGAGAIGHAVELVHDRLREAPRDLQLVGSEDVDGEMRRLQEVGESSEDVE